MIRRRIQLLLFILLLFLTVSQAQQLRLPELARQSRNFMVASDMGRNGYYEQKTIAKLMGEAAGVTGAQFVAVAGDPIHFLGVASVSDPMWMTDFELIYDHPELMIDWWVVCGNHEYRGSAQAIIDYSSVSRRWNAPSKYYSKSIKAGNTECLLVFIDTTPLIDKYREDSEGYPDAGKQDVARQLKWIEDELSSSKAKWKIVIGHHPVYAETSKAEHERTDMQARIGTIVEKCGADAYICGHIHNFQHIQPAGKKVHYIVNSSASQSRNVKEISGTKFCNPDPGFTICSVSADKFRFLFVNHKGETVYDYAISK